MELKEVKKGESYWYPFSKGVNRILIVILGFSIVIPTIGRAFGVGLFIGAVELILYYCFVWIYRGFKDVKTENTDKNNNL